MFEHPVCAHQPQIGLVRGQRRELSAPLFGRRLVETVQDDGIAAGPPRFQPSDGRTILVESVATLKPRCDEERGRHALASSSRSQNAATSGSVCSLMPEIETVDWSRHHCIVATPGVATVYDTLTADVESAIAAGLLDRPNDLRSVGLGTWTEPVDDLAPGATRNFSKFHCTSPLRPRRPRHGQLGERGAAVAVHVEFGEQGEGHAVGGGAEGLDLLGAAGLLADELVAGHAQDGEAAVGVVLGASPARCTAVSDHISMRR